MVRLLLLLLLLAGCGYRGSLTRLTPPDPALSKQEQKAARAAEARRVEAGLRLAPEARPVRVDEVNVRPTERTDNPFNLPPAGTRGQQPLAFPGDPKSAATTDLPPPAP